MSRTLAELGHFDALPGHYGEEGTAAQQGLPPEVIQATELITTAVGGQGNTPEELRARIANNLSMAKQMPFLATYYQNRARRLQGRLAAMEREEKETTQWRVLGQSGVGVGILVGFGVLGLVIASTARVRDSRDSRDRIERRLRPNPRRNGGEKKVPWWLVGLVSVGGGAVLALPDPVPGSGVLALTAIGGTWAAKLSEYGVNSKKNPRRRNPRKRNRRRNRARR